MYLGGVQQNSATIHEWILTKKKINQSSTTLQKKTLLNQFHECFSKWQEKTFTILSRHWPE